MEWEFVGTKWEKQKEKKVIRAGEKEYMLKKGGRRKNR